MTDDRIEKIKSAVEAADHIPGEKKAELLAVLGKLKPAIAKVAQTGYLARVSVRAIPELPKE